MKDRRWPDPLCTDEEHFSKCRYWDHGPCNCDFLEEVMSMTPGSIVATPDPSLVNHVPRMGKTLFLVSGATFTFYGVCDVEENETVLTFNYTARSDGRWKSAKFYLRNIAGHSEFPC